MPIIIDQPQVIIVDDNTIEVVTAGVQGPQGPQGPAGSGGNPGGSTNAVQFNAGSNTFGGSSSLTWNGTKLATTGLQLTTGPTSGYVLTSDSSGNATWQAAAGGSPGGSDTDIQFNNAGSFAGSGNLTWNNTNKTLVVQGAISQSAHLQEWQHSDGTVMAYMDVNSGFFVGSTYAIGSSGVLEIQAGAQIVYKGIFHQFYDVNNLNCGITIYPGNQTNCMLVTPTATTTKGIVVQGASSQSANLQEWQDSSGTPLLTVNSAGVIANGNATITLGFNSTIILSAGGSGFLNLSSNVQTAGDLCVFRGISCAQATVTTTYNASVVDSTVLGDATSGAFAINLPAAASASNFHAQGRRYTFKKVDSTANAVTVTANGSEKIDGSATYALSTQYKYVTLESDGVSKWYVVGNN